MALSDFVYGVLRIISLRATYAQHDHATLGTHHYDSDRQKDTAPAILYERCIEPKFT